jgi:CobQ-like glutamine amidotransferase family enzyme
MNKIKILHLYYDLLNLYGENGNIRYLVERLKENGIEVELDKLSINDQINFNKYDFVYIGMGTEENELLALKDIHKYKRDLRTYIETNKYMLVTGNALDLFGKTINIYNHEYKGLGLFDYDVKVDFNKDRIIGDQYGSTNLIDKKIIGFQNRSSIMTKSSHPFILLDKGTGSNPDTQTEGYFQNNFIGTYIIGPILVRNPYLTDYLISKMCNISVKSNLNAPEYIAYDEYIKNFFK